MATGEEEFQIACAHDRRGEEAEAIPHYRRALELGLDEADARGAMLGLGSSLRNIGEHAEAVQVLEEAVVRFPDYPALRAFLALARHSAGLGALAVADLIELAIGSADLDGYERALAFYVDELRMPPSRRTVALERWPGGLGELVVLGETHGNEAGPEALWALAELTLEAGEPVTIGVEAPERDSALFEMFVAGDADRAALLSGAFFGASWFDGRANEAMLQVFERARARRGAGDDVRVFGLVREGDHDPANQNPHEQRMANAVLERVEPGRRLVALVGSFHAQRTSVELGKRGTCTPMAARIAEQMPVDTVKLAYAGGHSWAVTGEGLTLLQIAGSNATPGFCEHDGPSFDWEWGVGIAVASPKA